MGSILNSQTLEQSVELPTVPELYCPFPSTINQHAEQVDQATIAWADRFFLLPDANAHHRLTVARVGWLISRAYPTLALEPLQFLTDWSTWLLVWDDICTESALAIHPAELSILARRYSSLLNGLPLADPNDALALAMVEIAERLERMATPLQRARFVREVEAFFEACVWEAANRAQGTAPDVATYIKMRPVTGGFSTYIALMPVTDAIVLPDHVLVHPLVKQLTVQANNIICWINDLISLAKELRHGEIHNLVLILRRQYHLSLQHAINRAAALHDAEVRAFLDTISQLPSFGSAVDAPLKRYITTLQSWMRGSLDWSYTSGRYLQSVAEQHHGRIRAVGESE